MRIKKLQKALTLSPDEGVPEESNEASYFVGKSQNHPVQLSRFVFVNSSDPAVREFIPKLKRHIFPRVVERLLREARLEPTDYASSLEILESLALELKKEGPADKSLNTIYFHSDRIYQHRIAQINYTTYDCRRDQDTLNSSTTQRDVMCIQKREPNASTTAGQFIFGRLLGVFHVNVIYGGAGMLDHRARRFDLLWICWYEPLRPNVPQSTVWSTKRMPTLSLMPLSNPAACDFLDPDDVVRAAHIIPRFTAGKRYGEGDIHSGRLFSNWAGDRDEWKEYYVNVFADRNMLMRFHWGMAVGHSYAHPTDPPDVTTRAPSSTSNMLPTRDEHSMTLDESMDVDGNDFQSTAETDSDDSRYDRGEGSEGLSDHGLSSDDEPDGPPSDGDDDDDDALFL